MVSGGITEVNGDPLAMAFLSHKAKTNRVIEIERINLPFWKFCPSPSVKKVLVKIIKKANHLCCLDEKATSHNNRIGFFGHNRLR